jgi:hypothetical protein
LLEVVKGRGQTLITTADPESVPGDGDINRLRVIAGALDV